MKQIPSQQSGMSALWMLVVILVAVFFGTCAVKLTPEYMEYRNIKQSIDGVVEAAKQNSLSTAEIRSRLNKTVQVNMIDAIDPRQVIIERKDGKTILDASYEKRVPLMFNIDVVLKFDQLKYEFTSG